MRKTYGTEALKVIQWDDGTRSSKLSPPDKDEQESLFNEKDFPYQRRGSRHSNRCTLKTALNAAYGLSDMHAQSYTKNSTIFHFGATRVGSCRISFKDRIIWNVCFFLAE